MTEIKLDISYEQTRTLVIEFLQSSTSGQGDSTNISPDIAKLAVKNGMAADPYANSGTRNLTPSYELPLKYKNWVEDIVWDLIVEGILRPGLRDGINKGFPWYHVSEYGRTVLAGQPAQPYDPDGFLVRVKAIPNIDDVIIAYVDESLKAFRIHCLLSSVITLGCASEKAILLLIEACHDALADSIEQSKFSKSTETLSIKKKHDELQKVIKDKIKTVPALPREVKEDIDIYINGLFSVIRRYRNEAGHPSGKFIKKEELFGLLVLFPSYLEKVYALIAWLKTNPI